MQGFLRPFAFLLRSSLQGPVLSLFVIAGLHSFPFCYCEHPKGAWQSRFEGVPTVLSLRGSFCEPKQSLFCDPSTTFGARDCHVRAKDALGRNDVVRDVRTSGNRHCEARSVSRSNLSFGFPNAYWTTEIATSGRKAVPGRNDS